MHALSASDIILAWEAGQNKHPVDRALLLLALALPEMSPTALSNLTVGQRNARLLTLRQKTLGTQANCFAKCPLCGEQLEFTVDIEAMRLPEPLEQESTLTIENFAVSIRLPNSADLASVIGHIAVGDVQAGRLLLLKRCVEQVEHDGQVASVADLPEQVIVAIAEAMAERDPQAEMSFGLNCPACQHTWTTLFDIGAFFWTEIEAQAKQLVREVHLLARAYGWREADIFALSATRRHMYLELIR